MISTITILVLLTIIWVLVELIRELLGATVEDEADRLIVPKKVDKLKTTAR